MSLCWGGCLMVYLEALVSVEGGHHISYSTFDIIHKEHGDHIGVNYSNKRNS